MSMKRGSPKHDVVKYAVRHYVEADKPVPRRKLAVEFNIAEETVQRMVYYEYGRMEGKREVDPTLLPKTARSKLEAAIRQRKKDLEGEFDQRVRLAATKLIEQTMLPAYNKEREDYRAVLAARKGVMSSRDYRKILACLHPDSVQDEAKQRYAEAFTLFNNLRVVMVAEDEQTRPSPLPSSYADLLAMRKRR